MANVANAALLTAFPVGAAALGAVIAAVRRPSGVVMSAVQHFAAGVVLAAVVGEILPDLDKEAQWSWAVAGFTLGVVVVLALAAWGRRLDARGKAGEASDPARAARSALPIGLMVTVAIDLLIDGALVGLAATLSSTQAMILVGALTLEVLFLALSVQGELVQAGMTRWRAAGASGGLGLLTAVGALTAAVALGDAGPKPIAATLGFGAAALVYLAVEELLVEAHEESETTVLTAAFFLGLITVYGLTIVGG
ncbi:ZIP family metal transporter [Flexivirga sp. ID2601S]|uniref:ZIP family metal transporter n=1 Tax=Flexivirga aerilata TaxID=1656889 RepID=A0A849ABV3_9MICO|nr:ZIP family metal transporter [Flexivirga aerilata]NNG38005.1 ZIP family metal transporter [Flexivirga aerilata]